MNRYLSFLLCLALVCANNAVWIPNALAKKTTDACPVRNTDERTSKMGKKTDPLKGGVAVEIHREFNVVNPDEIELDVTAARDLSKAAKSDVDRKIRTEYYPIRMSIINRSGKLLKIPKEDVYFINARGEKVPAPSDATVFKNVKRNGVLRALVWGVPLGAVSFGILAGPAFVLSGTHTKITNGTIKANIQKNLFHGGHVNPEGSLSTMLFLPKKQSDEIKQIALGRVINLEDEIETEKIIDIEINEPIREKKHRATDKKHLARK